MLQNTEHSYLYRHFMSHYHKYFIRTSALLCAGVLALSQGMSVYAAPEPSAKEIAIANHQAMPIESNAIANWPQGPVVAAESAILMDAETGAILYEKNVHEPQYPASTTKILTTLIASEECELNETVTFSHDAVFGIPRGSNHIAMNEGDTLSMEQCLDAILIRSANEVSYAVAEHIGGTWDGFAEMMNNRAKELGCVDSNFVNPNGLPDENHYTSAYDLAMIGRAFFANEMLCKITLKPKLFIPKEEEDLTDWNKMDLLPGHKYEYEYLVGCKTGYTDAARSTLVSCAEKDGMKLICVVLNDENPYHYEDTIALFNYGFSNFDKVNISQTETKYNIDNAGSFYSSNDIFGNSEPILSLNQEDSIILPKTADFADTKSSISYDTKDENQAAVITYTYNDVYIGSASVDLAVNKEQSYVFDTAIEPAAMAAQEVVEEDKEETSFIFINIVKVFLWIVGIAAAVFAVLFIRAFLKNYEFTHRNTRRAWLRDRRKRPSHYSKKRELREPSMQAKRREAIRQAKRRQKAKRTNIKFRDYDF